MAQIRIIPESIQLIKMSDEEYFSPKYKDYVSNSRLGLIDPDEDGSPEKYDLGYEDSEYNESFELGTAIHSKILQPSLYEISDILKPSGKLGLFAVEVFRLRQDPTYPLWLAVNDASYNANYYAGKLKGARLKTAIKSSLEFYKQRMKFVEKENVTTLFLSKAMKEKYEACFSNLQNSREILGTLYPLGLLQPAEFYNEYAILCEVEFSDEETGEITIVKIKCKLDNFTINHETLTFTLNDLKTTSKYIDYFMGNFVDTKTVNGEKVREWYSGSFQKYHYYRQLGLYLWLLSAAMKHIHKLDYAPKVNLLVIQTTPEFPYKVFPVEGDYIRAGLAEFKKLLTLVVEHGKRKAERVNNGDK